MAQMLTTRAKGGEADKPAPRTLMCYMCADVSVRGGGIFKRAAGLLSFTRGKEPYVGALIFLTIESEMSLLPETTA